MRGLRIGSLHWAVGVFCAVVGAQMLLAPHQLAVPPGDPLRALLPWLGMAFLLTGIAIFGSVVTFRGINERKRAEEALQQANDDLAGWVKELERKTREITLLGEMSDLLRACIATEEAYTVIGHAAQELFPRESGALYVLSPSRKTLEAVALWGESPPVERVFAPNACWALRRGQPYVVDDTSAGLVCSHLGDSPPAGYLCVPMMAHGETLGTLEVHWGTDDPAYPAEARERLVEARRRLGVGVAEQVALALANLQLQETLRSQAIRDSLTGLLNRRYMEESLEREVRRAVRRGSSLGIIMIDVDNLKQFNDLYGHAVGDALLREMGAFLQQHIRAEDIVCRYGGDEFTLILPEATLDVILERCEWLREGIKHLQVQRFGQTLVAITLSIGIAIFPTHGHTGEEVLQAADRALYRAKTSGRDQVRVAE